MSTSERSQGPKTPSTTLQIALGVIALIVLAYSVLIATRPLLGLSVVSWLVGLYLLWWLLTLAARFVSAFERIADALERRDGEL